MTGITEKNDSTMNKTAADDNIFAALEMYQYLAGDMINYNGPEYSRAAARLEGMRDVLVSLGYADEIKEIDAYIMTLITK